MESFTNQSEKLLPGVLLSTGVYFLFRGASRLYQSYQTPQKTEEGQTTWPKDRIMREVCTASMVSSGMAALYFALRNTE